MINNIQELLQKYFNESDHYLAPAELEHINTFFNGDSIFYIVKVKNECLEQGYETINIDLNDLLVWIYNARN